MTTPRTDSARLRRAALVLALTLGIAGAMRPPGVIRAEPRVIGGTQGDVRVLRGPGASPVRADGEPAAAGLDSVALYGGMFDPPPATADSATRAWLGRVVGAFGGPAALGDWLGRGVRRGLQTTHVPVRVAARYVERRAGERYRLEARVAGFDFVVVSTPEDGWQSIYGIVSDTPANEREEIAAMRAHGEDLLLDALRGGLPARLEPRPDAADTVAILVWGPRGSATRFRAARADGRLATLEFVDRSPEGGDAFHQVRFMDWRPVGSRTSPFVARHEGHVPRRTLEFLAGTSQGENVVDTLDLVTEVPDAMFIRPGAAPATDRSPRRSILALERHGDHHFADVRFGDGVTRRFLVDSGAGMTAVSRELAATLGIEPEDALDIAGVGGETAAQSAPLPPFDLGSHRLSGVRGIVLDLDRLAAALGTPFDGVLGVSAFARFAVTWDFERGVLEIAETRDAQSTGPRGTRVPFTMAGGLVFAPVQIDGGAPTDFVVDTGAWRTFLSATLGSAVANPPDRRLPGIPYSGVDGRRVSTEALRLRSLEIGGQVVPRPIVLAPGPRESGKDPLGALTRDRGVLGVDVLRRFRLTLDFPRQEMLLEPARMPPADDDATVAYFCGPGVALVPGEAGAGARVGRVLAESPAARAGIRVGDRVVAIDGRELDAATSWGLSDALAGPAGSRISLRVRAADGRERTVSLVRALLI